MARTSPASSKSQIAMILFQARLHREGKLEEYWAAKKAIRIERNGAMFGTPEASKATRAYAALNREYGYEGSKIEFEREKELQFLPMANKRQAMMAEYAKNRNKSALDKAFDALPNRASNDAEIAWVSSHPKMRRAQEDRLQNPDEKPSPVKMTVNDIVSPSNGPCPSKVAYTTLISWLADPGEFKKQMLSKQRDAASKGSESTAEAEGVVFDDLGEAERMLEAAARSNG